MALLKFKNGAMQWVALYANEIRNRLRVDMNLSDIADKLLARKNLELDGDNNQTHYHDSRYMPKIQEAEARMNQRINDEAVSRDNSDQDLQTSINNLNIRVDNVVQTLIVQSGAPSNPTNGMTVWFDTNEKIIKVYLNGAWVPFGAAYL
jgi:hypothetical protein